MVTKLRAPANLDRQGAKLWRDIASKYELRADELRILEDACRIADVITALEVAAEDQPLMVPGSHGGKIINPLVAEQKTHRSALQRLLLSLKLPDEGAEAGRNQQRDAAQTRWAAEHGKSA
jgi:hypothetical protein